MESSEYRASVIVALDKALHFEHEVFIINTKQFIILMIISAPYIEVCKRQADMFPCLKKNADACKPHMAEGIPEFNLPPMRPLVVPKLTIPLGEFTMVSTNASFLGMENFELLEMVFNLVDNFTLHASLRIPFIDSSSAYTAKGKILSLELDGSGIVTGNISK